MGRNPASDQESKGVEGVAGVDSAASGLNDSLQAEPATAEMSKPPPGFAAPSKTKVVGTKALLCEIYFLERSTEDSNGKQQQLNCCMHKQQYM